MGRYDRHYTEPLMANKIIKVPVLPSLPLPGQVTIAVPHPHPQHQRHQERRWQGSCSGSRAGCPPLSEYRLQVPQGIWREGGGGDALQCNALRSYVKGEGRGEKKGIINQLLRQK